MGERNAGGGRRGDGRGHPGHHVPGNAGSLHGHDLLGAAAEHEWVAALETADGPSSACVLDDLRVDLGL